MNGDLRSLNKNNKIRNPETHKPHKLINFTFKLSNSYSKFILIMNTQEQQTQNIQSQEEKNRNPKYSKICTQILPQNSIVHKHQPRSKWFSLFFFPFLCSYQEQI